MSKIPFFLSFLNRLNEVLELKLLKIGSQKSEEEKVEDAINTTLNVGNSLFQHENMPREMRIRKYEGNFPFELSKTTKEFRQVDMSIQNMEPWPC